MADRVLASQLRPVDQVEVLVVVDNVCDILSTTPDRTKTELSVLRDAGWDGNIAGRSLCSAQWGLSLLITTIIGDERHSVLFDTGPEDYPFKRNAERLGLPLEEIEAIVLSHGHWDHVGALGTVAREIIRCRRDPLEVHSNEHQFSKRGRRHSDGNVTTHEEIISPRELENLGALLILDDDERLVASQTFYLSAEIPRHTDYENGLPGHVRRLSDGSWVPDEELIDERYLAVKLSGERGVLVFTACGHAGIINTLLDAQSRFGEKSLRGLVGGFHLAGVTGEATIPDTVRDLAQFGLETIIPSHCTGWRATFEMIRCFGEDVVTPSAVGMRHSILAN